jgi:hypothetical protein
MNQHMKISIGWFLVLAVAGYLFMAVVVMGGGMKQLEQHAGGEIRIPDLSLFSNSTELESAFFAPLGADGRAYYRQFTLTADTLYPLSYTLVLLLALIYLLRKSGKNGLWYLTLLLPILGLMADLLENHSIVQMLDRWPESHPGWFKTYQVAWVLKFSSVILAFFSVVWLAIGYMSLLYRNPGATKSG